MSQILIKDINTPADFSWSAVFCDTTEKLKNYLKQDSIIIVSYESYIEDKTLYHAIKLTFPHTVIGVLDLDKENAFVQHFTKDNLDDFIASCIRKKYKITDKRKLLDSFLDFLNSQS